MEKSHVSLEQKMCIVTGKPYDTDALLLDRRLKKSMEKYSVTGWGISPEVQEKIDEGYIALVEIDHKKSEKQTDGSIFPQDAYRLGRIAYLKKDVMLELSDKVIERMTWADSKFLDYLESIQHENDKVSK